jgi:serine/threonine protein kinase
MYVLLTGRPCFPGNQMQEIIMKNKICDISYPPKHWDKISLNAKDLCQSLLKKNPDERMSSGDALLHPWFQEEANTEINDQTKEAMQEFDKEFNIDYANKDEMDVGNEAGISMIIPTPLLAKKNIQNCQ